MPSIFHVRPSEAWQPSRTVRTTRSAAKRKYYDIGEPPVGTEAGGSVTQHNPCGSSGRAVKRHRTGRPVAAASSCHSASGKAPPRVTTVSHTCPTGSTSLAPTCGTQTAAKGFWWVLCRLSAMIRPITLDPACQNAGCKDQPAQHTSVRH